MKKYYLPYDEKEKANYVYVLMFYSIAEFNIKTKRFDSIKYNTIKELTEKLNSISQGNKISESTVHRILKKEIYNKFLSVNSKDKSIKILNDITQSKKFVIVSEKEAMMLIDKHQNLLAKYYLYLKYYCGHSKSKKIDTTAKQFLSACGYSIESNSNISKISEYNGFLSEKKYINISRFIDNNGHLRNYYSIVS